MLWLLGMVVVVGQTGADYWWMGTQAFGGGEQLGNDLIEVQPGYSAVANEATSSRLIKDQQETEVATNPFLGVAQEPASEPICPEGQECRASCPQAKKKIRGYGGIQERIVQVSVYKVLCKGSRQIFYPMVGVSSQSSIICCCILRSFGCCIREYLLQPYCIYCCDYPILNFAL